MNIKIAIANALLVIPLVGGSFYFGLCYEQKALEPNAKLLTTPETQIRGETRYINETRRHYVENPIQSEVAQKGSKQLEYFTSLDQLTKWLAKDKTDSAISSYSDYDCDDYAYTLQQCALRDGYIISTELYWKNDEYHMLNSVLIGKDIYFVEPQDDSVWLHCHLD